MKLLVEMEITPASSSGALDASDGENMAQMAVAELLLRPEHDSDVEFRYPNSTSMNLKVMAVRVYEEKRTV